MSLLYVIGGGELGLPVLDWALNEGIGLAVTDRNPEAPGLLKASYKLVADALDLQEHLKFCDTIDDDVAGVICMSDEKACLTRTEIQLRFECEGPKRSAVLGSLNKVTMRDRLAGGGHPIPRGIHFQKGCVKKPEEGSGSVGVEKFEGKVIVEEMLKGRHIDVNGVFCGGHYFACGVGERFVTGGRYAVGFAGVDPAPISDAHVVRAHDVLQKAATTMGLTEGPVKADLMLTATGFVILEVTPRFHGEVWTTWTCPNGSGINAWKFYLRYLAGNGCDVSLLKAGSGEARWRFAMKDDVGLEGERVMQWWKDTKAVKTPKSTNEIAGYECWKMLEAKVGRPPSGRK